MWPFRNRERLIWYFYTQRKVENHLLFFESLSTFFLLLTELSIKNLCWGTALRKTASVDSSLLRGTADIVCMTGIRERALYTMNAMCFEDINTNVVPFGGILFMVYVCVPRPQQKSPTHHICWEFSSV